MVTFWSECVNASGNSRTQIPDGAEIREGKVTVSNGFH